MSDDEVLVDGQPMNPRLHISMHEREPFDLAGFLADLDALQSSWEQQRTEAQRRRRTHRPPAWIGGDR